MTTNRVLRTITDLQPGDHLGCLYQTEEECRLLVTPFLRQGLEQGEKVFYIADIHPVETILDYLRQDGVEVEPYLEKGQLHIFTSAEIYLRTGVFNPDDMIALWRTETGRALAEGYPVLRGAGEMTWALQGRPGSERLLEYESKLSAFLSGSRCLLLCLYEWQHLDPELLLDMLATHPTAAAGTEIYDNAYYLPQVELEQGRLPTAILRYWLRTLAERKQINEALFTSETRLQAAIDAADIGLWEWDSISGQIIWFGHYDKLFGFAPGEFDGTYASFEKRIHPEDLEELSRVVRHARDQKSEYAHEYRVIWPDGSVHWIAGRGRFVYDKTGQPVRMYGGIVDITELKQAEEALRQREFDLAAAQKVAQLGNWNLDFATNSVRWSDEVYRIFEVEKTDFDGTHKAFLVRVHPEDRVRVLQINAEARLSGGPFEVEYRIITPGGQLKHIRVIGYARKDRAGAVVGLFGSAQDITANKQAEQEIRQHATRMEALAEISQALAEVGLDVQAVFETLVQHAAQIIGDLCVIRLLSDDGQWLQPVAFHHPDQKIRVMVESAYLNTPVSASNNKWIAQVLQSGQGTFVPVVDQERIKQSIQPELLLFFDQIGMYSFLIVPLRVGGQVIGTLGLTRDQPGHPYTPDDQVLLQDLADRAALTLQNVRLFEQVQGGHERLQSLSRRLLEVQEAERHYVARELHDEIGQILTGLKLLLDMSAGLPTETVWSRLGEARDLVNELMERVSELSLDLRPAMLDDLGLLPTLVGHFERYTQQTQIQVTFQQIGLAGRRFSSEMETTVYRLVQEALTNVARHAGISQVTVRLWVSPDTLGVEIEDRGVGFNPSTTEASMGLSGMRERVALLGGRLTIESALDSGTTITVELPLSETGERSSNSKFG